MTQLWAITSRNLKQYLRDAGAVFFSLLSMLIVIGLMVFFLGDMNIDEITDALAMFPRRDAARDKTNATLFVLSWTCAGIISINAVTVTLGCLSRLISDRASGKLASIYTAPVNRLIIAVGYILSAWLSSVIICVLTLILTEIYAITQGMAAYTFIQHLKIFGLICVNSFVYSALMYFAATLVKTEGAWSGIGTVIGTLVGFLGGIYLPLGALAESIQSLLKCTPVIHSTAIFRKIMTETILETTFDGAPAELVAEYRKFMGIDLFIGDTAITTNQQILLLIGCGILFTVLSALVMRFGKKNDR